MSFDMNVQNDVGKFFSRATIVPLKKIQSSLILCSRYELTKLEDS
jgi:hypothetical protein